MSLYHQFHKTILLNLCVIQNFEQYFYWVNWIHAIVNVANQKNITTIHAIGWIPLKFF